MPIQDLRFLRLPEVMLLTGLSRSSVYLAVSRGSFPAPVKLGARAIGWSASAVEAWLNQRMVNGHTR
jgi:prophage regulatory protein